MRSRLATGLAVVLALLIVLPPVAALADGDPASDVLLGQNVFYPYSPATSKSLVARLNAATAAASKEHFPLKIALIASPIDLGIIPQLLGKPQAYAKYLDYEISFTSRQALLVVMKDGYGVEGLPGPRGRGEAGAPRRRHPRRPRAGRAHRDRQARRGGRSSDRRRQRIRIAG